MIFELRFEDWLGIFGRWCGGSVSGRENSICEGIGVGEDWYVLSIERTFMWLVWNGMGEWWGSGMENRYGYDEELECSYN